MFDANHAGERIDPSQPRAPSRSGDPKPRPPFRLLRQFAILSLLCILVISAGSAVLLSRFLTDALLEREAAVGMEFVASIVSAERAWPYFLRQQDGSPDPELQAFFDSFFDRLARLSGVVRANVYGDGRQIIWSSTKPLLGRRFDPNPELERAFSGSLEMELGRVGTTGKAEHVLFSAQQQGTRFLETYIPVWDSERRSVIGVVEIYRLPTALFAAIDRGDRLVWGCAAAGALLLYSTLFWIVRRGSLVIREQQRQLVETETLAALGEMASAVAHGIRNPLASIRSCAEVALEDDLATARAAAADIIDESDRLDRWIRELLLLALGDGAPPEPLAVAAVLRHCLDGYAPALQRRHIALSLTIEDNLPLVWGQAASLGHAINNLVANALEAMPSGGTLCASACFDQVRREVVLRLVDSGGGMALPPGSGQGRLVTTKPKGLGLGLALSQRILARHGGSLALASRVGWGAAATIRLRPAA